MHRFGERFIYLAPIVAIAAAAACSSEGLPITATDAAALVDTGVTTDAAAPTDATAGAMTITIVQGANGLGLNAYSPNPATVAVGTTVTWTNGDSIAHTATSSSGVWDSGVIPPGGSYSRVFSTAGTFPYFCTIHGAAAMSGTVVVQ
jgi:plastocyanin